MGSGMIWKDHKEIIQVQKTGEGYGWQKGHKQRDGGEKNDRKAIQERQQGGKQ